MRRSTCGSFDLPPDGRHHQRHQGTDNIENTVRHVDECGNTQHGGLRHAARVPRHQHGADRGRILDRAAQQPRFEPPLRIKFPEKAPRKDDRDILVGGAEVEEDARADGRGHGRKGTAHETQENGGQRPQHPAAGHHAAEAHGADDEPYGIEHARHAARSNQLVQLRASGRDRRRAEAAHQHALEPRHEIQPSDSGHLRHQFGLRQQHGYAGENRGAEERHDGREFAHDQHARRHGHRQQPGRDAERPAQ